MVPLHYSMRTHEIAHKILFVETTLSHWHYMYCIGWNTEVDNTITTTIRAPMRWAQKTLFVLAIISLSLAVLYYSGVEVVGNQHITIRPPVRWLEMPLLTRM
jgi:hypothetical protein